MFETGLEACGLYVGLNILWSLALSARTGMLRMRHNIMLGDGNNEEMLLGIRAHGNNIEYVPLGLIGLGVFYLLGADALYIHIAGIALTLGRVIHGIALSRQIMSRGRGIGMALTMAALLFIAGGCLYLGAS
jgi:uncharacterized membrane protein YecN with MAPEG domain